MKQPCERDCPNRDPYCRGTCDKWERYEIARNVEYDKRKKAKEFQEYLGDASLKMKKSRSTNGIHL